MTLDTLKSMPIDELCQSKCLGNGNFCTIFNSTVFLLRIEMDVENENGGSRLSQFFSWALHPGRPLMAIPNVQDCKSKKGAGLRWWRLWFGLCAKQETIQQLELIQGILNSSTEITIRCPLSCDVSQKPGTPHLRRHP